MISRGAAQPTARPAFVALSRTIGPRSVLRRLQVNLVRGCASNCVASWQRQGAIFYEDDGTRFLGLPEYSFAGHQFAVQLLEGLTDVVLTRKGNDPKAFSAVRDALISEYGDPTSDAPYEDMLWKGRKVEWRLREGRLLLEQITPTGVKLLPTDNPVPSLSVFCSRAIR